MNYQTFDISCEKLDHSIPAGFGAGGLISCCLMKYVYAEVKKDQDEGDEPRAETESESEEELSCFAPTVSVHISFLTRYWLRWLIGFSTPL